jgi:hypothetical protein
VKGRRRDQWHTQSRHHRGSHTANRHGRQHHLHHQRGRFARRDLLRMILTPHNPIITPRCHTCGGFTREWQRANRRRAGFAGWLHGACQCCGCRPQIMVTLNIDAFPCTDCHSPTGDDWSRTYYDHAADGSYALNSLGFPIENCRYEYQQETAVVKMDLYNGNICAGIRYPFSYGTMRIYANFANGRLIELYVTGTAVTGFPAPNPPASPGRNTFHFNFGGNVELVDGGVTVANSYNSCPIGASSDSVTHYGGTATVTLI